MAAVLPFPKFNANFSNYGAAWTAWLASYNAGVPLELSGMIDWSAKPAAPLTSHYANSAALAAAIVTWVDAMWRYLETNVQNGLGMPFAESVWGDLGLPQPLVAANYVAGL